MVRAKLAGVAALRFLPGKSPLRLALCACLAAQALLAGAPVRAQNLVSEEVVGNRRQCNYGGANGILSGSTLGRSYEVGIAENCPLTYPVVNTLRTPPPTAPLRSDTPSPGGRTCVYEQWGTTWTYQLPACPPAAGMAARDQPPPDRLPPPPPIPVP